MKFMIPFKIKNKRTGGGRAGGQTDGRAGGRADGRAVGRATTTSPTDTQNRNIVLIATTSTLFKATTKVAAFGRHHKRGGAAFSRAASGLRPRRLFCRFLCSGFE